MRLQLYFKTDLGISLIFRYRVRDDFKLFPLYKKHHWPIRFIVESEFSKPKNCEYPETLLLICSLYGSSFKIKLVAQRATLGNLHNLHKSKMAANGFNAKIVCQIFHLIWVVRYLFYGFRVRKLHI